MILNLFSMFDPSISFLKLSWLMLFIIILIPSFKKSLNYKFKKFSNFLMWSLMKEMSSNLKQNFNTLLMILLSMFFLLMNFNLSALMPYTFTITAHLATNFSFAFLIWSLLMIFQLSNNFKSTLTHLVPNGTPSALLPIMVLIELTSILIRPITLSVRLTANMIAGHLLMALLGEVSSHSMSLAFLSYPIFMSLLLLEIGVAFIQSYVFMTLISLYSNEAM